MNTMHLWTFTPGSWQGEDLSGFDVEALDGGIGSIDDATYEISGAFIVVDTGPWIFGKKVMIPAGVISRIDAEGKQVFVNRTKDEIKNAPEYHEDALGTDAYRRDLDAYYGLGGAGYRELPDATPAPGRSTGSRL